MSGFSAEDLAFLEKSFAEHEAMQLEAHRSCREPAKGEIYKTIRIEFEGKEFHVNFNRKQYACVESIIARYKKRFDEHLTPQDALREGAKFCDLEQNHDHFLEITMRWRKIVDQVRESNNALILKARAAEQEALEYGETVIVLKARLIELGAEPHDSEMLTVAKEIVTRRAEVRAVRADLVLDDVILNPPEPFFDENGNFQDVIEDD